MAALLARESVDLKLLDALFPLVTIEVTTSSSKRSPPRTIGGRDANCSSASRKPN
jgi:hypothetical protein